MKGEEILELVRDLIDDSQYSRYTEINLAYREICNLTKFFWLRKSVEGLITFKANVSKYQLDMTGMRRLERIWVKSADDEEWWEIMEESTPQLFEMDVLDNRNKDATEETNQPISYTLAGAPLAEVRVTPTPEQSYEVRVDYIEHPERIDKEVIPKVPDSYHETIALLAAGQILLHNANDVKRKYGLQLTNQARSEFEKIVQDSHPGRTVNIDRTPQTWLK